MKGKILTLMVIMAVAFFIYYNKGNMFERYKTRRNVENRIEDATGIDMNLKQIFKGMESIDKDIDSLGEEKLKALQDQLKDLSDEEKENLSRLLEEKGEDTSFLQDIIDDLSGGDNR